MSNSNIRNTTMLPYGITTIPTVLKKTSDGERAYDLMSRLLEDRIVMFTGEVNADSAQLAVAQLLYLASADSTKDITMYINSPGGSVIDGFAVYDTMQFIKPDVSTVVVGMAASMGSILLAGGAKGKRYALPNAEVLIHQPLGGMQGQASDMEIAMRHMSHTKENIIKFLAEHTGKDADIIKNDIDRDNWMTADEALSYGLIDKIIR